MRISFILLGFVLALTMACTAETPETAVTESETATETSQEEHSEEANAEDHDSHGDEHESDEHDEHADEHDESEDHDEHADEHHESEDHDEHSDEHDHDADGESREHGAHEHGTAELAVAWSGQDVAIDLRTPAYNVLGFEYAPATDAEKSLLELSKAIFEAGSILQLNEEAECVIITAVFEAEATKDAEENESTHSEIDISYDIECEQPENLQTLDISALFNEFPNFEDIDAQWISDSGQSAKELTANDPVLTFE